MAHGFLQSLNEKNDIRSAGTSPASAVSKRAIEVMFEAGIDISHHKPINVYSYLNEEWDYVITVCDNANESCPVFHGKVNHRLHIGFEDPSDFIGSDDQIINEFRRIRDEIKLAMYGFYTDFVI